MRLGLLAPGAPDLVALEAGAQLLLEREGVDRVVYLDADDTLDRLVAAWAARLVGDDPAESSVFSRAARACARGTAAAIDHFVARERACARSRAMHALPAPGKAVETIGGRVVVLARSRDVLEEADVLPASVLVYAGSGGPAVRRFGKRAFASPGRAPAGGAALLEEHEGGVRFVAFDADGARTREETVVAPRAPQMRVQGDPT